ncbi:MAG: rRNA pseudouridine synthase [Gammaproteobacteria bacterium]|nr:MAG: rRNA pseudouridine synthase [Gammaproteobacteria bacterium]
MAEATGERLQKLLANAGLGSRREIERWIQEGRITVNGRPARLGTRATREDRIEVDGRPVSDKRLSGRERYVILYNKPEGEMVTRHDPEGRSTVFDRLPRPPQGRWIAVGRLDINSAGLLLLTNDGELANRLMHPKYRIDREYAVRVQGEVTEEMVRQLVNGVTLEDGSARFEDVVESGGEGINRWFHVVIMEGRKREVRRLWEAVGARVSRLKRVRYGPIILDSAVRAGQWRELDKNERKALLAAVGMKPDRPWGTLFRPGQRFRRGKAQGTPWRRRRDKRHDEDG